MHCRARGHLHRLQIQPTRFAQISEYDLQQLIDLLGNLPCERLRPPFSLNTYGFNRSQLANCRAHFNEIPAECLASAKLRYLRFAFHLSSVPGKLWVCVPSVLYVRDHLPRRNGMWPSHTFLALLLSIRHEGHPIQRSSAQYRRGDVLTNEEILALASPP
jgi:hypothetical protein